MQTEKDLWLQISKGNQEAYANVYRTLYKRLYNYGKKFTPQEAVLEDALQDTLLSVWTKRDSLPGIDFPSTYFFSFFRYTLLAKMKAGNKIIASTDEDGEPVFATDQIILQKETDAAASKKLQAAINRLTSRQREAIFLRFYEGMSYERVAETLGITVKAAYKIMARALNELRQILGVSGMLLLLFLT